jgi:hypothetical protein
LERGKQGLAGSLDAQEVTGGENLALPASVSVGQGVDRSAVSWGVNPQISRHRPKEKLKKDTTKRKRKENKNKNKKVGGKPCQERPVGCRHTPPLSKNMMRRPVLSAQKPVRLQMLARDVPKTT